MSSVLITDSGLESSSEGSFEGKGTIMWPDDGEQPSSNVIISVLKRMSNNCILDVAVFVDFGGGACFGCTFAWFLRSDNLISECCDFCDILGCHPNRKISVNFIWKQNIFKQWMSDANPTLPLQAMTGHLVSSDFNGRPNQEPRIHWGVKRARSQWQLRWHNGDSNYEPI